jgi:glycosyltransferase involved in cell wall biosynthesis
MRIGIDASCWINRRGYGRFTRELLTALVELDQDSEYYFLVDFDLDQAPPLPARSNRVKVETSAPAARAASASGRRALRDMWIMGWTARRHEFDLFFFPSVYTYFPIPCNKTKVMIVIHDVIAERYPEQVFPNRWAAWLWGLKLGLARRQADMMMTVSEASRRGIAEEFGIPDRRISVIPEAADPQFRALKDRDEIQCTLAKWGLAQSRVLLCVGGISPHKNLHVLVEVLGALLHDPAFQDCKLVLAGDYQSDVFYSSYDALKHQIKRLGLLDAVVFTGYVTDSELVHLYNGATALVFPSLYEGFGLPALEAMACGTPVVASANGSLPEVLGDAGLLWDSEQPAELRLVLERLLNNRDLQRTLRKRGLERAGHFSWQKSARQTRELFHRLMTQN